jgi:hypothetical protein
VYIIKPLNNTRWRVMICQACGLDKKSIVEAMYFL